MLGRLSSGQEKSSNSGTLSSQSKRKTNPNKESSQILRVGSQMAKVQNLPQTQLQHTGTSLDSISELLARESSFEPNNDRQLPSHQQINSSTMPSNQYARPGNEQQGIPQNSFSSFSSITEPMNGQSWQQTEVRTIQKIPSKMRPKKPREQIRNSTNAQTIQHNQKNQKKQLSQHSSRLTSPQSSFVPNRTEQGHVQNGNGVGPTNLQFRLNAPSFSFASSEFQGRSYQPNIAQAQPFLPVQLRGNKFNNQAGFDSCLAKHQLPPNQMGQNIPMTQDSLLPLQTRPVRRKVCNNWLETGTCRFGKNCAYEHPVVQQDVNEPLKQTKCRTFHYGKYCHLGSMCTFRHEYKKFTQLLRHYYVVKLYCLESLFQYSLDQEQFVNEYRTGVHKLPVFQQIHNNCSSEASNITNPDAQSHKSEQKEDSTRSLFIELANELKRTISKNDGSSGESNQKKQACSDDHEIMSLLEEREQKLLNKLDSHSSGSIKRSQCWDLAAQMAGLFAEEYSSIDSQQFSFQERKTV